MLVSSGHKELSMVEEQLNLQKARIFWCHKSYLVSETFSLRANIFIARSKTEETFPPICMAWTEKLQKHIDNND